jgi:type III secretion system YscQ/HrcQ family protein
MKDLSMDVLSLTDQAVIWNAACSFLDRVLPLPGGGTARIMLCDAVTDTTYWSTLDGRDLFLRLENFDFAGLTGEAFNMTLLGALEPPLSEDVARAALKMILPLWDEGKLNASMNPQQADLWLRAEITHPSGGKSAVVLAGSQQAVVRALIEKGLTGLPTPKLPTTLASLIPIPVHLESGGVGMRAGALKSLRVGDCLLAGPQTDTCRLCAGRLQVVGQKTKNEWKVTQMNYVTEDETGDMLGDAGDAEAALGIDDIPVFVAFVIAQGDMTLADIAKLSKGAVLPLTPPETKTGVEVSITANGRRIGRGRIIEIDDEPAVRISQIFGEGRDD